MKVLSKKILLKYFIFILVVIISFSFMPNNGGNRNGCQSYNMSNIDGIFTIYRYTRDFNFGQPAIEYKNNVAFFLQTRGDTTTKFFNGNLSFCNNQLQYNNNIYYFDDSNNNGVGNQKWICNSASNTIFDYHFKRGSAKVEFDNQNKLHDTININNNLNINLNYVDNADSVIVTIACFNGFVINKRGSGLTQNINFTSAELSSLISGGIISVSALNILPVTLNNKNYLFNSVHHYLKLVYFKN